MARQSFRRRRDADLIPALASCRNRHLGRPPHFTTTSASSWRLALRYGTRLPTKLRPGFDRVLYGLWFAKVVVGRLEVAKTSGAALCAVVGRLPLWRTQKARDLGEMLLAEPRLQAGQRFELPVAFIVTKTLITLLRFLSSAPFATGAAMAAADSLYSADGDMDGRCVRGQVVAPG